jgi:hypothetical protein
MTYGGKIELDTLCEAVYSISGVEQVPIVRELVQRFCIPNLLFLYLLTFNTTIGLINDIFIFTFFPMNIVEQLEFYK